MDLTTADAPLLLVNVELALALEDETFCTHTFPFYGQRYLPPGDKIHLEGAHDTSLNLVDYWATVAYQDVGGAMQFTRKFNRAGQVVTTIAPAGTLRARLRKLESLVLMAIQRLKLSK